MNRHSVALLIGVVCLLVASPLAARATGIQAVAVTGNPAPEIPAGAVFSSLAVPAINDAGQVAFQGSLRVGTGGITDSDDTGIWSGSGGGLRLLAREGSHAPGTPAGAVFDDLTTGAWCSTT